MEQFSHQVINQQTENAIHSGTLFTRLDTELGVHENETEKLLDNMDTYFAEHGGAREQDMDTFIHRIAGSYPEVVVRRENPETLFHSLETGDAIQVRFREDAHGGAAYPNAGVLGWDGAGLRIPYQRGFGQVGEGKVVVVIGFTPNATRIHSDSLPMGTYTHYSNPEERSRIRMVEGSIDTEEDLKFVIVRFPRSMFPESRMTDEELENEKVFHISRAYSFEDNIQKENH